MKNPSANQKHIVTVVGFNESGIFVNDPGAMLKEWELSQSSLFYLIKGFVEWDKIKSFIYTGEGIEPLYLHTGTLLIIKGKPSPFNGTMNISSDPKYPAQCDITIFHPKTSRYTFLDVDKGLVWRSTGSLQILVPEDNLMYRIWISNHKSNMQTYVLSFNIIGEDSVTYYRNYLNLKVNAGSVDLTSRVTVNLGKYLTKNQFYCIKVELSDTEGNTLDEFLTPSIYYYSSGISLVLQETHKHLYLHVYDDEGRHVGLNYKTNKTEIEVPGAFYNDNQNGTILIILPLNIAKLKVVVDASYAKDKIETYNLTITLTENGEVSDQKSIESTVAKGEKVEYSLEILESEKIHLIQRAWPLWIWSLLVVAILAVVAICIFLMKKKG